MSFKPKTYAEAMAKIASKRAKTAPKRIKKVKTLEDKRSMKRWHFLVWEECKRIVRKRQVKDDGSWDCYTCGVNIKHKEDAQTAHGKPKSVLSSIHKYDLRNLKVCCYDCNINLGGCQDIFIAKLEREEAGLEFLREACCKTEDGYWKIKHQSEVTKMKDHLIKILPMLRETEVD